MLLQGPKAAASVQSSGKNRIDFFGCHEPCRLMLICSDGLVSHARHRQALFCKAGPKTPQVSLGQVRSSQVRSGPWARAEQP